MQRVFTDVLVVFALGLASVAASVHVSNVPGVDTGISMTSFYDAAHPGFLGAPQFMEASDFPACC